MGLGLAKAGPPLGMKMVCSSQVSLQTVLSSCRKTVTVVFLLHTHTHTWAQLWEGETALGLSTSSPTVTVLQSPLPRCFEGPTVDTLSDSPCLSPERAWPAGGLVWERL